MTFPVRSQIALVWWSIGFTLVYAFSMIFLWQMVPPPPAGWSSEQVKNWYLERDTSIKLGATVASWTAAFLVPLFIVLGIQVGRHEKGYPVWSIVTIVSGALTSIFLALPPIFFGTAAFAPERAADATAMLHQLGVLTFFTTDQFYIFGFVAVGVVSLRAPVADHSPFPRWYGYYSLWLATLFEAGALAFLFKSGPFAWRGLFVFYIPLITFATWLIVTSCLLLGSLKKQLLDASADAEASKSTAGDDVLHGTRVPA
ncbi:hypothetical protein [Sporichthya sp.]|uniref:hypothetical protein n=1 Tax=Sporichthya sp. TaxID=65475 RepID=UPI0017ADAEFD|nr:hypothetical protein [Sporichthya sp.]MBA3741425.1 hypothetical protein [Sporichthya sp.]